MATGHPHSPQGVPEFTPGYKKREATKTVRLKKTPLHPNACVLKVDRQGNTPNPDLLLKVDRERPTHQVKVAEDVVGSLEGLVVNPDVLPVGVSQNFRHWRQRRHVVAVQTPQPFLSGLHSTSKSSSAMFLSHQTPQAPLQVMKLGKQRTRTHTRGVHAEMHA